MRKLVLFLILCGFYSFYNINIKAVEIVTEQDETFKDALVISKEELVKGVEISEKVNIIDEKFYYQGNDFYFGNSTYFTIGAIDSGIDGSVYNTYPYIAYYENGILKWSNIYTHLGFGNFISYHYDGSVITVLGNYENKGMVYPFIIQLDNNGGLINLKTYEGNGSTFGDKIFKDYNYFIIIGNTYANSGDFNLRDKTNSVIYYLKVNEQLEKEDYMFFGNDGNNELHEVVENEKSIFILTKIKGKGEFEIVNGEAFVILKISKRGDYEGSVIIDNYEQRGLKKLVECNGKVYFVSKTPNGLEMNFYEIDDQKITKSFSYKGDFVNQTVQEMELASYDGQIMITLKYENQYKYYLKVTLIEPNGEEKQTFIDSVNKRFNLKGCMYNGYYLVYYGEEEEDNSSRFIVNAITSIKLLDNYLLFNGEIVEGEILNDNYEIFGNYKTYKKYSYRDINLYVSEKVYIYPKVSIENEGVYDLNTVLNFNGDGYLNGEKIENGKTINKEGVYTLKLEGSEDTKYYTFEIKDMSLKVTKKETTKFNVDLLKQKQMNKEINVNYEIYSKKETADNNYGIYVIVLFIIAGSFASFLIKPRRGDGKNV